MSSGYRHIVTALAGLATLCTSLGVGAYFGSLYGPDRKHYEAVGSDTKGGGDYRGPAQSLPDVAGLPGPVERAVANPPSPTAKDHESRDLAAQEASAMWAFWMVVVSALSALVTLVGTIFLYKQIILTREAVEDTGRATEAMGEANAIARQSLNYGNRAWLDVEVKLGGSLIWEKADDGSDHLRLIVCYRAKNYGSSPALDVSVSAEIVFGVDSREYISRITRAPRYGLIFPTAIFPNEWGNWTRNNLGVALSGDVYETSKVVLAMVIVSASYRTIHDGPDDPLHFSIRAWDMRREGIYVITEGDCPIPEDKVTLMQAVMGTGYNT